MQFRTDFVRIYDGDSKEANELATLTGTGLETSIFTSTGRAITIRFQSDVDNQRSGFSLQYSSGVFSVEIKKSFLSYIYTIAMISIISYIK